MDLHQMLERDLLVTLIAKMDSFEGRFKNLDENVLEFYRDVNKLKIDVARLQTEIKIYAAIAATLGSALGAIATNLIH
jgi:hypothetical protein